MKKEIFCTNCGKALPQSNKKRIVCEKCGYVSFYHEDTNSYKATEPVIRTSSSMRFV